MSLNSFFGTQLSKNEKDMDLVDFMENFDEVETIEGNCILHLRY